MGLIVVAASEFCILYTMNDQGELKQECKIKVDEGTVDKEAKCVSIIPVIY